MRFIERDASVGLTRGATLCGPLSDVKVHPIEQETVSEPAVPSEGRIVGGKDFLSPAIVNNEVEIGK